MPFGSEIFMMVMCTATLGTKSHIHFYLYTVYHKSLFYIDFPLPMLGYIVQLLSIIEAQVTAHIDVLSGSPSHGRHPHAVRALRSCCVGLLTVPTCFVCFLGSFT